MIVLLGASGYIGQAFAQFLRKRNTPFTTLARKDVDYTRFDALVKFLRETKPAFLVNAAGYTGRPNVDACEVAQADTLNGNTVLPQTISQACEATNTPWGHVSSGCIFTGAKIVENGHSHVEKDLTRPDLRAIADQAREKIRGFTEADEPNFSFRQP